MTRWLRDVWLSCSWFERIGAYASKDREIVYDEMEVMRNGGDVDDLATLQHIEDLAVADPDHDWRVVLHGPLRGREYQRHGPAHWVLIDSDQGFA